MDDTIYRQAAIDATWEEPTYTDPLNVLTEVRDKIEALPSAQAEITEAQVKEYCEKRCLVVLTSELFHHLQSAQRTGRWIFETLDGTPGYRPTVMFCSKCGRVSIADYSYCPNCGAKMEVE